MLSNPSVADTGTLARRKLNPELPEQLSHTRSTPIILYPFLLVLSYICALVQYCTGFCQSSIQFNTTMPLKDVVHIGGRTTTTTHARPESAPFTADMRKLEFYRLHSEACAQLRTALDMDNELQKISEKGDKMSAHSRRTSVVDHYYKSVTSLEKAIQYFTNHLDPSSVATRSKTSSKVTALTGPELERARSTCEKMRGNKQGAMDRIDRLESMQFVTDAGKLPLGTGDGKNRPPVAQSKTSTGITGKTSYADRRKTGAAPIVTLRDDDEDIDDGFNPPNAAKNGPKTVSTRPKPVAAGIPAVASRSRPLAAPKAEAKPISNLIPKAEPVTSGSGSRSFSRSSSNNSIKATKPVPKKPVEKKLSSDVKTDARNALRGVDRELADRILDNVLQVDDKISLDDVQGQETAKQALHELVILPAVRPEIFTGLRAPIRGLLLYGPPGNGKTMLAKAVAGEAGLRFFNISASALTSKWIGDGEKLVRALFACAKILQPSVIFVDEIDSLLKSRSDSEHDSMRRLKTEFLIQFDGVDSSSTDRILVMGATNRPWELDEAATRRFPKRVYVQLPDAAARTLLIEKLLHDQQHSLTKKQIRSLAEATEGYSGSDLTNLARDAALGPVRLFKPEQLKRIDVNKLRPINEQDFLDSLKRIRPSCSDELVQKLEQWSEQRGEG